MKTGAFRCLCFFCALHTVHVLRKSGGKTGDLILAFRAFWRVVEDGLFFVDTDPAHLYLPCASPTISLTLSRIIS
jgi:hypothetical protein